MAESNQDSNSQVTFFRIRGAFVAGYIEAMKDWAHPDDTENAEPEALNAFDEWRTAEKKRV